MHTKHITESIRCRLFNRTGYIPGKNGCLLDMANNCPSCTHFQMIVNSLNTSSHPRFYHISHPIQSAELSKNHFFFNNQKIYNIIIYSQHTKLFINIHTSSRYSAYKVKMFHHQLLHINSIIQKMSPILNSFPPCLIIFVGSFCIEIFFGSKSQQTIKRNHKYRNGITEMKPVCLISHIYIHAHTHSQETITLNKIIINYIVIVCLFLKNMLKYCIEILTCPFSPCNLDGKY